MIYITSVKLKLKSNAIKDSVSNQQLDIKCPNCNTKITFSCNSIGSQIICPNCKMTINLQDDGFSDALNDIQKSIEKMFK